MIEITRKIEFDAGHRIPDHKSKCRNAHGHRYVLEATVVGPLVEQGSSTGMVHDFSDLKQVMIDAICDHWDHAFLVWNGDYPMMAALRTLGHEHKTIVMAKVPTVENLVEVAAREIGQLLDQRNVPARLCHVRLYETPNCWADWFYKGEDQ